MELYSPACYPCVSLMFRCNIHIKYPRIEAPRLTSVPSFRGSTPTSSFPLHIKTGKLCVAHEKSHTHFTSLDGCVVLMILYYEHIH